MATTYQQSGTKTHRSGWATFAAWILLISGFFQMTAGLVAIIQPELYIATDNNLFIFDYNQWGWISLTWGIIMSTGGASLLSGKMWGRIVAAVLATISAIINFAFIWAYPIWSILIIILNIMIIYSVTMKVGNEE